MDLKIVVWPDKRLLKKCEPVSVFDSKLTQLVVDMQALMLSKEGAGLAAPQIGISKSLFVYRLENSHSCMINPVIIEEEGEQYDNEGCLSFPGVLVKVKRANKILVEFQDVEGKKTRLRCDGFLARCIQHEIDHLNGIVFVRYLSKIKRDLVTRKMTKAQKRVRNRMEQLKTLGSVLGKQ